MALFLETTNFAQHHLSLSRHELLGTGKVLFVMLWITLRWTCILAEGGGNTLTWSIPLTEAGFKMVRWSFLSDMFSEFKELWWPWQEIMHLIKTSLLFLSIVVDTFICCPLHSYTWNLLSKLLWRTWTHTKTFFLSPSSELWCSS